MKDKELKNNLKHHKNLYKVCMENKNKQTKKMADLQAENIKLKTEKDIIISNNKETCKELLKEKVLECEEIKTSLLGGGGKVQQFLRNFENKISGGMIGQIRKSFDTNYKKELQNLKNLRNKQQGGGGGGQIGGNPLVFLVVASFKVGIMTLGTLIFNWWPIMMLVSFYCLYLEWKMIKLSGENILGVPIIYLLCAYLCPCIWTLIRLFMGFKTNENAQPKLFNILSKCTDDGFTINFHEYFGRDCKDNKCLWTTNTCYETLFNKNV